MDPVWQPNITLINLKQRAEIYSKIREFFAVRGVMEVETPVLSQATVTDPYLQSLTTLCCVPGTHEAQIFYL